MQQGLSCWVTGLLMSTSVSCVVKFVFVMHTLFKVDLACAVLALFNGTHPADSQTV